MLKKIKMDAKLVIKKLLVFAFMIFSRNSYTKKLFTKIATALRLYDRMRWIVISSQQQSADSRMHDGVILAKTYEQLSANGKRIHGQLSTRLKELETRDKSP